MNDLELTQKVLACVGHAESCIAPADWVFPKYTEKQRLVLQWRVIDKMRLSEVAVKLKVSGSRVKQIRNQAMRKATHPYTVAWANRNDQ